MERELVKIASDNPAHPHGYYTQFKDRMKPGDVVFVAGQVVEMKGDPGPGIQLGKGEPPAKPIKYKRRRK